MSTNHLAASLHKVGYAYVAKTWVIRDYSADFARGKVAAILGPNGRGKTTLLNLLTGAAKPTEGDVNINGEMAFVPQLFETSFGYTALDMVLMGRARKIGLFSQPSRRDAEHALAMLDRVGLADLAYRPFHEMSGGQRQLVIFARALVADADIVILDEPTSSLDLKNQGIILEWIARLSRQDGLSVVFTTHHPHHALAVADDALLMQSATSCIFGPAKDVLNEQNLSALYETPLRRVVFEHEGRSVETLSPVLTI